MGEERGPLAQPPLNDDPHGFDVAESEPDEGHMLAVTDADATARGTDYEGRDITNSSSAPAALKRPLPVDLSCIISPAL